MATGILIPVEEYLRTYYDPDREYVDGQVVERSVGERRHSRLQSLLVMEFGKREKEQGFEVIPEQRIITRPGRRYRIPDICVKKVPYDPVPVLERPDLTIEILSPDDTLTEAAEKCAEYLQAGIPANWVCDPYRQALYSYGPDGLRLVNPPILENELTGPIDFAAIFAELDLSGKRR